MKISILKDYRGLKQGESFFVTPNRPNIWVGPNGCGKSTLAALILTSLSKTHKKLVPSHLWQSLHNKSDAISIADLPEISGITFFSDKQRSTQMVDMDALMGMGMRRLWASEGQNSQQDFKAVLKNMSNPNHLFILDEIDGHFDYDTKLLFFSAVLNRIQGTCIIISHDTHFLRDRDVLDFNDRKVKSGRAYYLERDAIFQKQVSEARKNHEEKEAKKKEKIGKILS